MAEKKAKFKDFESALERLEAITDELELGEVKLEKAMELYSEGVEIAAYCNNILTASEKKIMILKEENEKLVETPMVGEGDNGT